MKSTGFQNSKFPNLLVNWENFESAAYAYIKKTQIFNLFDELRCKICLWVGKNLEI